MVICVTLETMSKYKILSVVLFLTNFITQSSELPYHDEEPTSLGREELTLTQNPLNLEESPQNTSHAKSKLVKETSRVVNDLDTILKTLSGSDETPADNHGIKIQRETKRLVDDFAEFVELAEATRSVVNKIGKLTRIFRH